MQYLTRRVFFSNFWAFIEKKMWFLLGKFFVLLVFFKNFFSFCLKKIDLKKRGTEKKTDVPKMAFSFFS